MSFSELLMNEKRRAVDRVIDLVLRQRNGPTATKVDLYDDLREALALDLPGPLESVLGEARILAEDRTGRAMLLAAPMPSPDTVRVGIVIIRPDGKSTETSIVVSRENAPGLAAVAFEGWT